MLNKIADNPAGRNLEWANMNRWVLLSAALVASMPAFAGPAPVPAPGAESLIGLGIAALALTRLLRR